MFRYLFLFSIALALTAPVAAMPPLDVPYDNKPMTEKEKRRQGGGGDPAESEFSISGEIKIDKNARTRCAEGAAQQIEAEAAMPHCDAAIAADPENAENYYYRAYNLFHLGRYEDAEAGYTAAIERNTRFLAESYYQRGTCKELQHRLRDAAADFKSAHELKPEWYPARRKVEEYHWAYES